MKTLISILAMAMALNAGGVLGFKFGDTSANVDKILKAKGCIKKDYEGKGAYIYTLDKFGGIDCDNLILLENEGKQIIKSVIVTAADYEVSAFSEYTILKNALTKKYGETKMDEHFYRSPYSKGDGYANQAFRMGKGFKYTSWETEETTIFMELKADSNSKFYIKISYEDRKLMAEFVEKKKEIESGEL